MCPGRLFVRGVRLHQLDLELTTVAASGHGGEIAEKVVSDPVENDGIGTREDEGVVVLLVRPEWGNPGFEVLVADHLA